MPTSDYWSSADLKALATGGLIREDVMQKIWDISRIPLPFMDLVGVGEACSQANPQWTTDAFGTPDLTNAVVDGADAVSPGNESGGARVGNHCQQSDKVVQVTARANASNVIGRSEELGYQLSRRQHDLMRDLEAISLYPQASVADNGNATAGKVGTLPSWLVTNDDSGAGGAATGYNTGTGLVAAPTPSTNRRAFSVATWKTLVQNAYLQNGNVTAMVTRPELIARLNAYILANPTAFGIATPTANVSGTDGATQTAQGYVGIVVTDFGTTIRLIPNRLQQTHNDGSAAACVDVFGIDPSNVFFRYLIAPQAYELGRLGSASRWQLLVDWTLQVSNENAHFCYRDVNHTTAVVV